MRDHIFRGVRLDGKGWVKGSLSHFKDENGKTVALIIEPNKHGHVGRRDEFLVDPETVGEYIGVKGKHGKMLFEDDMIKGLEPGEYDVVVYECNKFILSPQGDDCVYWDKCEVIGTIHDSDSGEG